MNDTIPKKGEREREREGEIEGEREREKSFNYKSFVMSSRNCLLVKFVVLKV